MSTATKRTVEQSKQPQQSSEEPKTKNLRVSEDDATSRFSHLKHGKGRAVPRETLAKLSGQDAELLENVKTSCIDLERISAAIQLRMKHRLSVRLPEDEEDSTYYIENGLRKVYPYPYLYQAHVKHRWLKKKLKDVLREEFRDISEEELKKRFDSQKILVNGVPAKFDHVLKDNEFLTNLCHRHELPVLATPIKVIYQDKETLVVDKPPSIPVHCCGRYRHNSVINILSKEYGIKFLKTVHRLDRLVSGVLIFALNSTRAHKLESSIKERLVQKEYVCRVDGEFPVSTEEDGYITVDQPLDSIPGKIGITVVIPSGKQSITKFKRLNYNGKTSTVLCKPLSGRMHQIRVHLQYLGYPIVNDCLYNCDAFGPERGKGARFGKSFAQLSKDVIAVHKESSWLMTDGGEALHQDCDNKQQEVADPKYKKVAKFLDEDERKETMNALAHYFTSESWKDIEQKFKFNPDKLIKDPTCRDCTESYHDPPLRSLFLYLHALRYTGPDWSHESEMPVWARDDWKN